MKAVHARTLYAFAGVRIVRSGWLRAHVVWLWVLFLIGLYASRLRGIRSRCHPEGVALRASKRGCRSWVCRCIEQASAYLCADRYVQECAPVPAGEWRMAAHNKPPFEETRESLEKAEILKSTPHGDFIYSKYNGH
jgi:hypothetical protein